MVQMLLLFFAVVLKMGYLFAFIFQKFKGLSSFVNSDTFKCFSTIEHYVPHWLSHTVHKMFNYMVNKYMTYNFNDLL